METFPSQTLPTGLHRASHRIDPDWYRAEPEKALVYARTRLRRDLSDRLGQILESEREFTVRVWEQQLQSSNDLVLTLCMTVFVSSVDAALIGDAVHYAAIPTVGTGELGVLPDNRAFKLEGFGDNVRFWRRWK